MVCGLWTTAKGGLVQRFSTDVRPGFLGGRGGWAVYF